MEKINLLFSKFDQFIFNQIDQLKKSAAYEQVSSQFEQLSSDQQKIANRILTFGFILLPLLVLTLIFWGNYSKKNELEERTEISSLINQVNFKRSMIQSIGSQFLNGEALENEGALLQKISSFLNGTGVNRDQLNVEQFESFALTDSLQKTEASLKFKKMTTEALSNLLEKILRQSNFKVSNIDIKRNKEAKIDGELRLHYFGKK